MIKTQKKLYELKSQSNDIETYLTQLDSQMSAINSSLDEVNGQIEPDRNRDNGHRRKNLLRLKRMLMSSTTQ